MYMEHKKKQRNIFVTMTHMRFGIGMPVAGSAVQESARLRCFSCSYSIKGINGLMTSCSMCVIFVGLWNIADAILQGNLCHASPGCLDGLKSRLSVGTVSTRPRT